MSAIEPIWQEYFDHCYRGKNVPKQQMDETQQAFYSGMLAALSSVGRMAEGDEKAASQYLEVIHVELLEWCKKRVKQLEAPLN